MGILKGCFGKRGCFWMVFGGEVVVNCVVNRGGLHGRFSGLKICQFI
jgi:hypothetical protein